MNSESEIACSMCARSILSASHMVQALGSFIFECRVECRVECCAYFTVVRVFMQGGESDNRLACCMIYYN